MEIVQNPELITRINNALSERPASEPFWVGVENYRPKFELLNIRPLVLHAYGEEKLAGLAPVLDGQYPLYAAVQPDNGNTFIGVAADDNERVFHVPVEGTNIDLTAIYNSLCGTLAASEG